MGIETLNGLPAWLQFALSFLGGAVAAVVAIVRWQNSVKGALTKIDIHLAALPGQIEERIAASRHTTMALIQSTVIAPLDKLEEEVKQQGKQLAVLIDRYSRQNPES